MNRALIGAAKVANGGWRRACGVVPLLVIVGVGVALRAWPFGERSFWFDEAFSWRLASFPWRELFQRSALDNNPPLFYVLLKIWIACFGDSPAAMRSLSLLAGAAGCVGVYLMVVEAFREPGAIEAARRQWTGLFAAALIAVTTLQIRWGGEARMYALGAALAAFSTWLLLRALRAPLGARPSKTGQAAHSRAASAPVNCATTGEIIARVTTAAVSPLHAWAFYALAALAFMYTHTYALFSVVAQAVFALGYLFAEGRYDPATLFRGRRFRRAVVAFGLVAAGWLPWVPVLVRQNEQVQDAYWTPPLTRWSVPGICHQIFADPENRSPDNTHAAIAAAMCCVVLLALLWRPRAGDWLLLLSAALPTVLAVTISARGRNILSVGCFIFAQVFLLAALARVVARIAHWPERTIVAGVILGTLLLLHADYVRRLDVPSNTGLRLAAEHLRARRRRGEPVIVCYPFFYLPVRYYLRDDPECYLLEPERRLLHFEGTAALAHDDVIKRGELARLAAKRAWVVGDLAGGVKGWRERSRVEFFEGFGIRGSVTVVEYATCAAHR